MMKKYYRNAVRNNRTGKTDTYVSERQKAAPSGWTCTGVCGSFAVADDAKYDVGWANRSFFVR